MIVCFFQDRYSNLTNFIFEYVFKTLSARSFGICANHLCIEFQRANKKRRSLKKREGGGEGNGGEAFIMYRRYYQCIAAQSSFRQSGELTDSISAPPPRIFTREIHFFPPAIRRRKGREIIYHAFRPNPCPFQETKKVTYKSM